MPTLLRFHANGRNKSQHCWAQQCWVLLANNEHRVHLRGPKSLTGFKLNARSANIVVVPCKWTQQVTTLLGPTMLGVVGQQCWVLLANNEHCVHLRGPKSLTGFKLNATSANIVVVPCKWAQQVTTLLGPTMLGPFARAFKLLRIV